MGRPSLKTPELIEEMLSRLIEADDGLEGVCKAPDMPAFQTVYRWLASDPEFQEAYARARVALADVQAFRGVRDAVDCEDAAKARVQLDARKWLAAKLDSKRYGDKIELNGTVRQELVQMAPGDEAL